MNAQAAPLLELRGVSRRFTHRPDAAQRLASVFGARARESVVRAVDDVSLAVREREVVGLVGESGCGKSTLGRMVARILEPTAGERYWRGRPYRELEAGEHRAERLAVQMIFQDPYASLNPRMRIADIVGEAPVVHGLVARGEREGYVAGILERVGLDAAAMRRFPHQFSGGQRSRIGIARALAVRPRFLVCDEAVAALDVSIQAQVLNLFIRLREELGLTYLFISHDLGVIRHLSDRVLVMYLGRIVESAPVAEIYGRPNHPYTEALIAEVPRIDARKRRYVPIRGEIPSPLAPPPGCHFHPRCPKAFARCRTEVPALREVAPGHLSACHLNDP
jgi:peptide/nickel transport system ATP-binding protein